MTSKTETTATDSNPERSYEPIKHADLRRLAELVTSDLEEFLSGVKEKKLEKKRARQKMGQLYGERLLLLCLCQGAATHFVHEKRRANKKRGVKDFDVWAFYARHPERHLPYGRRVGKKDFGPSRFGRYSKDNPDRFKGRRVDIMCRSIPHGPNQTPKDSVLQWLEKGKRENKEKHSSAWHVAKAPVVVISPEKEFGKVIWEPGDPNNS